jgi:hypothetical protein
MAKIINGDKYRNAPARVVARALAREREVTPGGCWLWTGQVTRDGYGCITYGSRTDGKRVVLYVHRLVYMHFKGDPGDEMQVDHLCHDPDVCTARDDCPHRRCYNPAHLLAVTPAQNRSRCGRPRTRKPPRTCCDAGHEYTEANTRWYKGVRVCKKCDSLRATARIKAIRRANRKPCEDCGADMSDRPIRCIYCAECARKRKREKYERYHQKARTRNAA